MALTPIEYANKLRSQLLELQQTNRPLVLAVTTVTTQMHERIFNRGIATDGGKIGNYNDTRIMYLNPDDVNVFGRSEIGKPGKFKNGNDRKTVKLTYKGYKSKLGKPSGGAYVNLELAGDLQSDFINRNPAKVNANEYVVKFNGTDNVSARENFNKAIGNEQHFGKKIFFPNNEELNGPKGLYATLEFELRRMFSA